MNRILMLIDQFYPVLGGAEQQALRISLELQKYGYHVSVLTRQSKNDLPLVETYRGIKINRLPFDGTTGAAKLKSTLPAARWLVQHKDEYDLLHCHGNNPFEWSAMLAHRFTHKPYLMKLTNPNFLNYSGASKGHNLKPTRGGGISNRIIRPAMLPFLRYARKSMIRRADRVLAISPEIIARLNDIGYSRVTNVPNGIDTDHFHPVDTIQKRELREKLSLSQDAVIFLYAGRFAVEKNLMTLLKAWHKLSEASDYGNLNLILLGDSKGQVYSSEKELRMYAREKNMVTLSFKGTVPNVIDYLQASDVFVLTSFWEGMSNSLLESMACGLPALVSDIPANSALVDDKKSGLLFPARDHHALCRYMRELIEDPEKRLEMGKEARRIAENRFSINAVVKNIIREYDRLLHKEEQGAVI